MKVQKNRLTAVNLLPCGGSTPGGQICGNPNAMNFASRPAGLQAIMSILRSAFLFRMKIRFTLFFAFRMTTE
ncbi:hypothetical protein QEP13_18425 [Enterobacter ludwigii]|uniref:hypothetical protein n=1 Tax=Enterobacter TaxID=547 RepID=UPI001010BE7F|nr:hypothetical protein [Enterobacter cloacae]